MLALIAGTHGTEYARITRLAQIAREVNASTLSGTVIVVHIAGRPAFLGRINYHGLNRAFPGNPDGTASERIAHLVTTEVIRQADYWVDLHAGEGNETSRPYVYQAVTGDAEMDEAMLAMALAFGVEG